MDLAEFLLERIAEDEAAARDLAERGAVSSPGLLWWHGEDRDLLVIGPERVLAECEAKRKIVEKYLNWCEPEKIGPNAGLGKPRGDEWARATRFETEMILIIVANIYADHPDFRDEWRL